MFIPALFDGTRKIIPRYIFHQHLRGEYILVSLYISIQKQNGERLYVLYRGFKRSVILTYPDGADKKGQPSGRMAGYRAFLYPSRVFMDSSASYGNAKPSQIELPSRLENARMFTAFNAVYHAQSDFPVGAGIHPPAGPGRIFRHRLQKFLLHMGAWH